MTRTDSLHPAGDHADLAGYLLDALPAGERARVDDHLAGCAGCRGETDSLLAWTTALTRVPAVMLLDGPPDGGDLLLRRALRQVRESHG